MPRPNLTKAVVDLKTGKNVRATHEKKVNQDAGYKMVGPSSRKPKPIPAETKPVSAPESASASTETSKQIGMSLDRLNSVMAGLKAGHAAKTASVTNIADAKAKPKAEGYDFDAAKKQNAESKAKQAENIKNQDIKAKIDTSGRRW